MKFPSLTLSALASLIVMSYADQSNYIQQLSTLSQGALDTTRNSSGIVWLNVSNFASEKLPYIQQDLGLYTYDNLDGLKTTASLAAIAASNLKYGDLVYFFTAFATNGYGPYIHVASNEMQQGTPRHRHIAGLNHSRRETHQALRRNIQHTFPPRGVFST